MAKLIDIATQVQDFYFQNFAANDTFFEIDDFMKQVAQVYSDLLDEYFQQSRKETKASDGFVNVEIPVQWMIIEHLEMNKKPNSEDYTVTTSSPIFAFKFDGNAYALQPIRGVGTHSCKYRMITIYEREFLSIAPSTSLVYYYLNKSNEIVFLGSSENLKVEVRYLPEVDGTKENAVLADGIADKVKEVVLSRFFKSKNGNFIDKVNDQNPNVIPAQQVSPSLGSQ